MTEQTPKEFACEKLGGGLTVNKDLFKYYTPDEWGDVGKSYLNAAALRKFGEGCIALADEMESVNK